MESMKFIKPLLLWLFCSSASVFAEPADLWVLTNLEPPFSLQNERGKFEGITIEVVDGILKEANLEQQILAAPWERVFKEASSKPNILIFALVRTPEREKQFHWITPLSSVMVGVFSLDQQPSNVTELSQLDLSDSIGVLDGDFRQVVLVKAGAKNIVPLTNWTQGMQKLLNGEIKNIFFSSIGVQIVCQQLGVDCSQVKRLFAYKELQTYVALSLGSDAETINKLTQAAVRFKQSMAFMEINRKWISKLKKDNGLLVHLDKGVLNLWPE
jgi:polar amino acid transport system substrate-binding protein